MSLVVAGRSCVDALDSPSYAKPPNRGGVPGDADPATKCDQHSLVGLGRTDCRENPVKGGHPQVQYAACCKPPYKSGSGVQEHTTETGNNPPDTQRWRFRLVPRPLCIPDLPAPHKVSIMNPLSLEPPRRGRAQGGGQDEESNS